MHVYLPIAGMSVNVLVFLGLGAAVGFLSGLYGVGGGFLLTPLLIFLGIPPIVAVGTGAALVVASSVSGAVTQYRRNNVDLKMGGVMLIGGFVGAIIGVNIVHLLNRIGYFDFLISMTYITFLTVIGTLMFLESFNIWKKSPQGQPASRRKSGQHNWVDGLPLKMRFHRSKLYISTIPPLVIGMFVGFLAGVMGIGGGFVVIPAMIYLVRMPTSVVVGTALFQIVFVAAFATFLHVLRNHNVDFVLAAVLIAGGVLGAQFGALSAGKLRGGQLRTILAVLVLVIAIRLAFDLVVTPEQLFSMTRA